MSATHGEQPATSAGAAPVPMILRAIAAWLEPRPDATVQSIDLADAVIRPNTVVYGYLVGDDPGLHDYARLIDDDWAEQRRYGRSVLEWQIAPGVVYRLTDARS